MSIMDVEKNIEAVTNEQFTEIALMNLKLRDYEIVRDGAKSPPECDRLGRKLEKGCVVLYLKVVCSSLIYIPAIFMGFTRKNPDTCDIWFQERLTSGYDIHHVSRRNVIRVDK